MLQHLYNKGISMAKLEMALLGGGCFWCIEAVYSRCNGVISAISGYAGGARANPSYEQVCSGATGHAEVVEITYDADVISYQEILEIFWKIHNPTTLNQQGADRGTQYRSVIYYYTEEQKAIAVQSIKEAQLDWDEPIVTELSSAPEFYEAEAYHQDYFTNHPTQGYCHAVVRPKVEKFMSVFREKVKE